MIISAQPKDIEQKTVAGGLNGLIGVQNYTVASGTWQAISTNYETKQILLQPRDRVDWDVATVSGQASFLLREGSVLEASIVAVSGTVLCWVKPYGATTFELLIGW
jgi:hypothetical protein